MEQKWSPDNPGKIVDGTSEAVLERNCRLPVQQRFSATDIGTALHGIVLGQFVSLYRRRRSRHGDDLLSQFINSKFGGIAQIDRPNYIVRRLHQGNEPACQVIDITERPGLAAIAIKGNRLAFQRLDNEIGDDAPVIGVHSGAVSVEDTRHSDIYAVLAMKIEK